MLSMFQIEFESENSEKEVITGVKHNQATFVGKNKISFQRKYANPVLDELKSQLDSCRQLLALEPDSKCKLIDNPPVLLFKFHVVGCSRENLVMASNFGQNP